MVTHDQRFTHFADRTVHLFDGRDRERRGSGEAADRPEEGMPPRILIADDQADVRESLRLLLKSEGFKVDTAGSPGGGARRRGRRRRRTSC